MVTSLLLNSAVTAHFKFTLPALDIMLITVLTVNSRIAQPKFNSKCVLDCTAFRVLPLPRRRHSMMQSVPMAGMLGALIGDSLSLECVYWHLASWEVLYNIFKCHLAVKVRYMAKKVWYNRYIAYGISLCDITLYIYIYIYIYLLGCYI